MNGTDSGVKLLVAGLLLAAGLVGGWYAWNEEREEPSNMAAPCILSPEAVPAVIEPPAKILGVVPGEPKMYDAKVVKRDVGVLDILKMRVELLEIMAQEQRARLSQEQAIFADKYQLSVDKLRAGQYEFKKGQFAVKGK